MKILRANALRPANIRGGHKNGVSTSRSFGMAHSFADDPEFPQYAAVLVLDKSLLAKRYQIKPYDDIGDDSEQEEAIIGTIRPLSDYLVSINIPNFAVMMRDEAFADYLTEWDGFPTIESVRAALHQLATSVFLNRVATDALS